MSLSNNKCDGFKTTLKACYRIMNLLQSNPDAYQDNICDEPFNQYIFCLQVICLCLYFIYY